MTNEEFVNSSNPHSWFLVADDLHTQATKLRRGFGLGETTRTSFSSQESFSRDNTNRSIFLLASFALENAIKAFLVYENPGWISNGTLSRQLRSHKLTELAGKSKYIPQKESGFSILEEFEKGNESWARYPCSLSKDETKEPSSFSEGLWDRYEWLMAAYGEKLVQLLSEKWRGPHGFEGRYIIEGSWFGIAVQKSA